MDSTYTKENIYIKKYIYKEIYKRDIYTEEYTN